MRSINALVKTALGPCVIASVIGCVSSSIARGDVILSDGMGVTLDQVIYSFPGATGNGPSATGEVDVNVSQLAANTNMSSGFINIITSSGWVTQNLPVFSNFTYPSISTTFNLGTSGPPANLSAQITYTSAPLSEAPAQLGPLSPFKLGTTGYNAQGIGLPTTIAPAPPPVEAVSFLGGLIQFVPQPNHPNVQTALNQCAPAAAANSFAWLQSTYGLKIPDPNVPGRGDTNTGKIFLVDDKTEGKSLVGSMDLAMNRQSTSRVVGNGVFADQQLTGMLSYLGSAGLSGVLVKHQGISPYMGDSFTGAQNVTVAKITSIGNGATVTPDFIISELQQGEDLKYDVVRSDGSGHAMDIVGAGYILGIPFIEYVSDHLQTPNDLSDNLGTGLVDFSFLIPQKNDQPVLLYGPESGTHAFAVISVSVDEPTSIALLVVGLISLAGIQRMRLI